MAALDVWVVALVLMGTVGVGLWAGRRTSATVADYFVSGRSTPWWLAGLSMVATTFAADTPLAVTELVRTSGISGNWLWWNALAGGMLTTFFFARYWRRSGVTTDLELISLRYSGAPARWLRGVKAVYLGLLINAVVIGWVNLALMALLQGLFGLAYTTALLVTAGALALTLLYVALAGLRGVLVTDALQFGIAMVGCIALAVLVVQAPAVGGLSGLVAKVPAQSRAFFPSLGTGNVAYTLSLGVGSFLAYAAVQWWASWYPGAEPGGGGYIAQRILAAKNERHGLLATLLFNVLHYAVRPWPWVLVAAGTLVLYPELSEHKLGYVYAIRDLLPTGLKGLLVATFFAAYMSTISTQLNWGASYLVNDLYQRWRPQRPAIHYVQMGRWATGLIALIALGVTTQLTEVSGAWEFLLTGSAGMGLVLMLRWYWWRISAWSEIVATLTPLIVYGVLLLAGSYSFPTGFFIVVAATVAATLLATYLLPGTRPEVLTAFAQRVQPAGAWGPYRVAAITDAPLGVLLLCWLCGLALVYGALFGLGYFLFLQPVNGVAWLLACLVGGLGLWALGRRYPVFG
ncbi:MAG: sodium:solute symporter family protein [Bacteroidia bacterium]|nr:sodium:solute symporter family protein [Bacteroidia bacterium]